MHFVRKVSASCKIISCHCICHFHESFVNGLLPVLSGLTNISAPYLERNRNIISKLADMSAGDVSHGALEYSKPDDASKDMVSHLKPRCGRENFNPD